MAWGVLANAVTTGLAALAYGAAAVAAQRRQRRLGHSTSAAPLLFLVIAVYLALAAARQAAAWQGADGWDRRLYYAVIVPAALVIVPHVHLVTLVKWGQRRRSLLVAAAFLLVVAVGIVFAYTGGIEGPVESEYGTDWTMNSGVTKAVLVGAIMLPGLAGSVALVWMARNLDERDRRRVSYIGLSCLLYFFVFTLDALGLSGLPLLFARLVTAATGIVALLAYRPVGGEATTFSPPPGRPDEAWYERR
jgi:hypothetical protein